MVLVSVLTALVWLPLLAYVSYVLPYGLVFLAEPWFTQRLSRAFKVLWPTHVDANPNAPADATFQAAVANDCVCFLILVLTSCLLQSSGAKTVFRAAWPWVAVAGITGAAHSLFYWWCPLPAVPSLIPTLWDVRRVPGATETLSVIALLGVLVVVRALLHADFPPNPQRLLRPYGVYRHMRNPDVMGCIVVAVSTPHMTPSHALFAVLTYLCLLLHLQVREARLCAWYGRPAWFTYCLTTPQFWPRLGKSCTAVPLVPDPAYADEDASHAKQD